MTSSKRHLAGFDRLLATAGADGVTDPRNLPFYLTGPAGGPGLLLIHGFSASPWEMRLLGDKLHPEGFNVLAVRLPGHGTTPEQLERCRLEQWQQAVREGFDLLREQSPRVYVAGQSTGALLALDLCRERQPAGLLLLSPFLRIRNRLAPLAGWLWPLRRWRHRQIPTREAHAYYARQPVRAVGQLNRLLRRVWRSAARVEGPVMFIGSAGDATVDAYSALHLFRRLGTDDRSFHLLGPRAPHVLTSSDNPQLAEVLKLCRMFLHRLEPPSNG